MSAWTKIILLFKALNRNSEKNILQSSTGKKEY